MTGPFGLGDLAQELLRLTQSPRVRLLGDAGRRAATNYGAGPFSAGKPNFGSRSPSGGGDSGIGAAIAGALNGANRSLGSGAGAGLGGAIGAAIGGIDISQMDPMTQLYNQLLEQLQSPVAQPQAIDKSDLMRQVQAAINPIYDARAKSAKDQTGRATADVQGMYKALSQDYEKLAPQQAAQAAAAQDQIKQLYGQLRSNIEGSYSRVSKEQADLFQQLGIQDALPDVLGDQNQAVTDATTAAAENQAQQQQRYMDIGNMDETYYREGAPNAILQGNEVSQGLLSDLGDYLNQIEGERSAGIQSGYLDQLGQAQSQFNQQQQQANSEAARKQEFLWQMLQSQLQGNQQAQNVKLTPDTYMGQLPPEMQQSVAGAFTQLQRSPEAVYGKVEDPRNPVPGSFVEITPEWYMSKADEMLQQGKIDPVTHQALQMYIQLYFGSGQ